MGDQSLRRAASSQRKNHEHAAPVLTFLEQDGQTVEMTPEMLLSVNFDMAVTAMASRLNRSDPRESWKNLAIALRLGVSESLVSKWRNKADRELPSQLQIIALGSDFVREYNRAQAILYGFPRKALLELLQLAGELAQAAS